MVLYHQYVSAAKGGVGQRPLLSQEQNLLPHVCGSGIDDGIRCSPPLTETQPTCAWKMQRSAGFPVIAGGRFGPSQRPLNHCETAEMPSEFGSPHLVCRPRGVAVRTPAVLALRPYFAIVQTTAVPNFLLSHCRSPYP